MKKYFNVYMGERGYGKTNFELKTKVNVLENRISKAIDYIENTPLYETTLSSKLLNILRVKIMNDEIKEIYPRRNEILNNIKEYFQNELDNGWHKFIYNDLGWDEKCIDCINAIDDLQEENERLKIGQEIDDLQEENERLKIGQEIDENTIIYQDEAMIYLIGVHIIIKDLKWHDDGDISYLTLKEIHEQIPYSIRIICESALKGKIYEFGNYNDGKWRLHGITKGYA